MGSHEFKPVKHTGIPVLFLCILWSLTAALAAADSQVVQTTALRQPVRAIRISTNLVTVPVSVTDTSGQTVANLSVEDFQIAEDGHKETVSKLVQAGQSPLQLVLVFDLSGSIYSDFEFERMAASRFIEKVWKPGDTISILSVSKRPAVCLTASPSSQEALKTLSNLQPSESATAFFDSIVKAAELQKRATAPSTRQAAVIFSDGEDNRSDSSFSDALSAVRHSNIVVYSINPSGTSIRLNEISIRGQKWLAALAGKTGGTAFVSNQTPDLDDIYDRIAFELRAQYLLSYYSSNTHTDGAFRSITVSLPGKPGLRVRARQGYYAMEIASEIRK